MKVNISWDSVSSGSEIKPILPVILGPQNLLFLFPVLNHSEDPYSWQRNPEPVQCDVRDMRSG